MKKNETANRFFQINQNVKQYSLDQPPKTFPSSLYRFRRTEPDASVQRRG